MQRHPTGTLHVLEHRILVPDFYQLRPQKKYKVILRGEVNLLFLKIKELFIRKKRGALSIWRGGHPPMKKRNKKSRQEF